MRPDLLKHGLSGSPSDEVLWGDDQWDSGISKPCTPRVLALHQLLLVAAVLLLPYPRFLTGGSALAVAACVYFVCWLSEPRLRLMSGQLALFSLVVAGSLLWSTEPSAALSAVGSTLMAGAIGFAVGDRLPPARIRSTLEVAAGAVAVVSVLLFITAPGMVMAWSLDAFTLRGIYSHKNHFAFVMLIGLSATLFGSFRTFGQRFVRLVLLGLFFWCLHLADSTTAIVLAVLALLFRLFFSWWQRRAVEDRPIWGSLLVVLVAGMIALLASASTLVLQMLGKDPTLTARTGRWEVIIELWRESPWIGFGWGAFDIDERFRYLQLHTYGHVATNTQNGYLQVLAEVGIIGALALALVLLGACVCAVRRFSRRAAPVDGWILLLLLIFLITNFFEEGTRAFHWAVLGMIVAMAAPASRDASGVGLGLGGRSNSQRVRRRSRRVEAPPSV